MNLYIKVVDGFPVNHPLFEENLLEAFPEGIPACYEPFERVQPTIKHGTFEKLVHTYLKNQNNVWTEEWSVADMTAKEKERKINDLTMAANNYIEQLKQQAINAIAYLEEVSDSAGAQIWNAHLDKINQWALVSVAPVVPEFPSPPYQDDSGNWVQ
jgi:hypothetical protein